MAIFCHKNIKNKEQIKKIIINQELKLKVGGRYRISDMIPVALPPRVAGDGIEDLTSYFV